jgi:2-polyprenyl-6-hydroxyphenyl methylase/3-demethylubiquinone-9 3-methyltransferase
MTTTINKEEIQKFSKLADEWWDVNGKFKPLHMFNPIRIEYITDKIKQHFKINADNLNYLKGLNILDIGCGGGLISEPMARLGGRVTGIDASEKNIKVAKIHAKNNELKINYLNKSPEELENRSFMSYLKAIIGAEYIMRWLPIGTHDWSKFLKPEELEKQLQDKKFSMVEIKGLEFNPFLNKWRKSNNLSVNYIITSSKS